jgi:hypothetical protein
MASTFGRRVRAQRWETSVIDPPRLLLVDFTEATTHYC